MARGYVRVKLSVLDAHNFRELTTNAQWLLFALMSSPNTSLAGVTDWRPARIASLAAGRTAEEVEEAGTELVEAGMLVLDQDTEEAFVVQFIESHGPLEGPKTAAGMRNAWRRVYSTPLKAAIAREVASLATRFPELRGITTATELIEYAETHQEGKE